MTRAGRMADDHATHDVVARRGGSPPHSSPLPRECGRGGGTRAAIHFPLREFLAPSPFRTRAAMRFAFQQPLAPSPPRLVAEETVGARGVRAWSGDSPAVAAPSAVPG